MPAERKLNEAVVIIVFACRSLRRGIRRTLATELGALFGMSAKAIRDVWLRRTWKNVTDSLPLPQVQELKKVVLNMFLCQECKLANLGCCRKDCEECRDNCIPAITSLEFQPLPSVEEPFEPDESLLVDLQQHAVELFESFEADESPFLGFDNPAEVLQLFE